MTASSDLRKKLTGSFYTPEDVVTFMCNKAIQDYLSNFIEKKELVDKLQSGDFKSPFREEKRKNLEIIDDALKYIKVIDPAAGDGAFILGMLDEITKLRSKIHEIIDLDFNEKSLEAHAINNSLFGVDISKEAVALIKKKLKSRGAKDEKLESAFIVSNALTFQIEKAFFKIFKENNGFDIVISNPPYISYYSNTNSRLTRKEEQILKQKYEINPQHKHRLNSMNLFVELGIKITKRGGIICLLVNKTLGVLPSYKRVREYILKYTQISHVIADLDFFDAIVDCMIITLRKTSREKDYMLDWSSFKNLDESNIDLLESFKKTRKKISVSEFKQNRLTEFHHSPFDNLLKKIESCSLNLGEILNINRGINIGGCKTFFWSKEKKNPDYYKYLAMVRKIDLFKYEWQKNQGYVKFDSNLETELRESGKTLVLGNPERYIKPRLFIPESSARVKAAIARERIYSAYGILVATQRDQHYDLEYACALLNSSLVTFYAIERQILRKGKKATPHIGVRGLKAITIPKTGRIDLKLIKEK